MLFIDFVAKLSPMRFRVMLNMLVSVLVLSGLTEASHSASILEFDYCESAFPLGHSELAIVKPMCDLVTGG